MKTLINHSSLTNSISQHAPAPISNTFNSQSRFSESTNLELNELNNLDYQELLTSKALFGMAMEDLPDLWILCMDLYRTFLTGNATHNALQFLPVLNQTISISESEIIRFQKNTETNHVLIQNLWLKVVLIHWKPGKYSSIHGHPKGGCVFKVLHGSLEEKRYAPDAQEELLSISKYHSGSMAYIDDKMAFHAVGNPSKQSAISLHVYTPGIKDS